MTKAAGPLAARARWFELNAAAIPETDLSENADVLRAALRSRVYAAKPSELEGLDFREAVNAMSFAWKHRPDLRSVLAERLWNILPLPRDWPKAKGEVAAARFVLNIARSEEVTRPDALRLADDTAAFLIPKVCVGIHTLPLFLLLWNLASLRYERGTERSFSGVLPDDLAQTVLAILEDRVKPKGANPEKVAQFSLAGLLSIVDPSWCKRLALRLQPLAGATRWLSHEALSSDAGFVPAMCALEGIALLQPRGSVFNPMARTVLESKYQGYEDKGLAVAYLHDRLGGRPQRY
jgi:hypothetical protein